MYYKRFKFKSLSLSFHKFSKTTKTVSNVYLSGIRNWVDDDSYNYSIVIWTFRTIFSIERKVYNCQG